MDTYEKGQLVTVTGRYTNAAGNPVDPAVPKFDLRVAGGTVTTYTYPTDPLLVKDSIGVYHVNIDCWTVGLYNYRFYGTGANQAANEDTFQVVSPGGF